MEIWQLSLKKWELNSCEQIVINYHHHHHHCYHETLCKDRVGVGKYICKVTYLLTKPKFDKVPIKKDISEKLKTMKYLKNRMSKVEKRVLQERGIVRVP